MRPRLSRPSHATIVAYLALFVALGGGAYATTVAQNTVKSSSIKNGQVKTQDIHNRAVTSKKLKPGAVPLAYADLQSFHCNAMGTSCSLDVNKGITTVTRPSTGGYCITVGGADPNDGVHVPVAGPSTANTAAAFVVTDTRVGCGHAYTVETYDSTGTRSNTPDFWFAVY